MMDQMHARITCREDWWRFWPVIAQLNHFTRFPMIRLIITITSQIGVAENETGTNKILGMELCCQCSFHYQIFCLEIQQ